MGKEYTTLYKTVQQCSSEWLSQVQWHGLIVVSQCFLSKQGRQSVLCPNGIPVYIWVLVNSWAWEYSKVLERKNCFHHCSSLSSGRRMASIVQCSNQLLHHKESIFVINSRMLTVCILQRKNLQQRELNLPESHSQFQSQASDAISQARWSWPLNPKKGLHKLIKQVT